MSFLTPLLATLGSSLINKASSWIGKKLNGTFLGNVASHVNNNYDYSQAL